MIRCVILDDERLALGLLADYLASFPDFEVVGAFQDGFDGFKGIFEPKPDLVFLDIEMPNSNGVELLELLDELPKVIFTTACDRYAVRALEERATWDYLRRVVVKTGNNIPILPVDAIAYFSAEGDYVKIVAEGKGYLKLGTMGYFENVLNPDEFTRIHRYYLVNVSTISKIETYWKEDFLVYQKDGTHLPVRKSGMGKLKKSPAYLGRRPA